MKWAEMTPEQRNALVAEKVMEWNPATPCNGTFVSWHEDLRCHTCGAVIFWGDPKIHKPLVPPRYSESMDAAMLIVESHKFLEATLKYCELWRGDQERWQWYWECSIVTYAGTDDSCHTTECRAKTAPEAICVAALIACRIEVEL